MQKVDYIIVGGGYAGIFFAHQLLTAGKSFKLFAGGAQGASHVSAGVVNPVVLKKFTTFWLAQEQIDCLKMTLTEMESYTGKQFHIDEPVCRIFHDDNEKKLWEKKQATDALSPFLSLEFTKLDVVNNEYGIGTVLQSGRLDVHSFFSSLSEFLNENGNLKHEIFDYKLLDAGSSVYMNLEYSKIIFCEGMGVLKNPFFCQLPVQANKGHHLKVKLSSELNVSATLKKKHFLFSLRDGNYYYGGTYDRHQLDEGINPSAVEELESGLKQMYPHEYITTEVTYGFRPTVGDRRPILGAHETYKNMYVFNGLGARGILNGSYFAKVLFQHTEFGSPLPAEVDLKRFTVR